MNVMLDFICMVFNVLWATGSKRKYTPRSGIEPATPCFPACRSNHSDIKTVNNVFLKLLQYVFTLLSNNTFDNVCMKLILVRYVLELTVRQNLHFFYQYRCYLLLLTERCMNEPLHNQFVLALPHVLSDNNVKRSVKILTTSRQQSR